MTWLATIFIAGWILKRRLLAAFRVTIGALVDLWESIRYVTLRYRFSTRSNSHRWHSGARSVWDIIAANEKSTYVAMRPGQHADRRGARYAPAVWHLLRRLWDEREAYAMAAAVVGKLMSQIRWMLDHPPLPETEHGCTSCQCHAIERWKAVTA